LEPTRCPPAYAADVSEVATRASSAIEARASATSPRRREGSGSMRSDAFPDPAASMPGEDGASAGRVPGFVQEQTDLACQDVRAILRNEPPAVLHLDECGVRQNLSEPLRVFEQKHGVLGRPHDQRRLVERAEPFGGLEEI